MFAAIKIDKTLQFNQVARVSHLSMKLNQNIIRIKSNLIKLIIIKKLMVKEKI